MSIPIYKDLSLYPRADLQEPRYKKLVEKFESTFGGNKPDFISRSPGRVNLIGEHIDYCDYSVMPLAIDVDVIIAVKSTEDTDKIELVNIDPKFEYTTLTQPQNGELFKIDQKVSHWSNYFKCSHIVADNFMKEKKINKPLKGLQLVYDGTVPTGGGLSSSAAFVCASTLAILHANGVSVTKSELTKITVVSEHYVGVNTGGMDQSASVCGEKNHVLYVQFKPTLKATPISFPKTTVPFVFLIANSLKVSNKHQTAPVQYNLRVVEVSVAACVIANYFGLTLEPNGNLDVGTLRGAMDAYFAKINNDSTKWDGAVDTGITKINTMLNLLEEVFIQKDGYTVDDLSKLFKITKEEFIKKFLTKTEVRFEKLQLYLRAKHVYSEALRVLNTISLLNNYSEFKELDTSRSETFLKEFGELMNQSGASCKNYFECTGEEIDTLVSIARSNGSSGSRVTGAGWGGSSVHVVKSDELENVKHALINDYYKVKFPNITEQELKEALVVSEAAVGSSLYTGDLLN